MKAGWVMGPAFLLITAFLSYVSLTYIVEAMANANALLAVQQREHEKESGIIDPLLMKETATDPFYISLRIEIGQMAEIFFNNFGQICFYILFILYLYGSSTIFASFAPSSILKLAYLDKTPPTWMYDICLLGFAAVMIPLCLSDFQKTKYLQIVGVVVRQVAVVVMIVLAFVSLASRGLRSQDVPLWKFSDLPNLVGGAVYSFMCHHSLPGIISPMREKEKEKWVAAVVFSIVACLYLLLSLSVIAAYGTMVESPVTFNFSPHEYGWVGAALYLFPVVNVASNFPLIVITLRNNLISLSHLHSTKRPVERKVADQHHYLMSVLAVIPPVILPSLAYHGGLDINSLVGITGGYAGSAVLFIFPALLIYTSRRKVNAVVPGGPSNAYDAHPRNKMASPFHGHIWPGFLIVWAVLAIVMLTIQRLHGS